MATCSLTHGHFQASSTKHPSLLPDRWFTLTMALGDVFMWPGSCSFTRPSALKALLEFGGGRRACVCANTCNTNAGMMAVFWIHAYSVVWIKERHDNRFIFFLYQVQQHAYLCMLEWLCVRAACFLFCIHCILGAGFHMVGADRCICL